MGTKQMKLITHLLILAVCLNLIVGEMNIRQALSRYMNGPKKELFKAYHRLLMRDYDLNSEEGFRKYRVFKDVLKKINEGNKREGEGSYGIGIWTDMTDQEFKEIALPKAQEVEKIKKQFLKNKFDFENMPED